MIAYLTGRVLVAVLLLWGVLTLTFALVHLAPGDPVDLMVQPDMSASDVDHLRRSLGLDAPLGVQYGRWLLSTMRGDLGTSLQQQRPVTQILRETIPMTLRLSIFALLLHYSVGTALGVVAAIRRGSHRGRITDVAGLALYSIPTFWLGLMLQLLFCYQLRWLPSGGAGEIEFAWSRLGPWFFDASRHMLLPLFVLGLSGTAGVARFMRGSMLDTLHEDFVRTARGKGLTPRAVFWKHALRNAAIPLVTLVGLGLPFVLSGAMATEVVFGWPGMGRLTVDAIFARDYPLILATTMISASLVVLGNLLADIGYGLVDPRIRAR
jgi:peptide/nickel transport system permease protein